MRLRLVSILAIGAQSVRRVDSLSHSSSPAASRAAFLGTVVFATAGGLIGGARPALAAQSASDCGRGLTMSAVDEEYPGTAVERMEAVRGRVRQIAGGDEMNGKWEDVRRRLLWAGGLRDLPDASPGQGYTGHSFNDYNHVDLTTMASDESDNTNNGQVKGIAMGNRLGTGIRLASLPELGPGGSWSTCAIGCNADPLPRDVAHLQFKSRIAFKLVWVPNADYDTFVLVDDDGKLLARGTPSDGPEGLPALRERQMNYKIMSGSKYSTAADEIASEATTSS